MGTLCNKFKGSDLWSAHCNFNSLFLEDACDRHSAVTD